MDLQSTVVKNSNAVTDLTEIRQFVKIIIPFLKVFEGRIDCLTLLCKSTLLRPLQSAAIPSPGHTHSTFALHSKKINIQDALSK